MIRWCTEVWELVSDAVLQSSYYCEEGEVARGVEKMLKQHPDYNFNFNASLLAEMAWRWMQTQPPVQFQIASQDPDALDVL